MTTITIDRAVVEQALEALTVAWQQQPRWQITESMHNLRATLAQQDEPKPMSTEQRQRWEELAAMPQQAEPVEPVVRECSDPMCACRGGPCAECDEGEREKEIEDLRSSLYFYRRRCEALQSWQSKMRDPERTIVCDILANGKTLDPAVAGNRYTTPQQAEPVQEPYTGDVTRIMRDAGMTFHLGLPHKAVVEQMTRVVDLVYAEASIKAAQQFAAALAQQAEPVCKCDLRTRLVGDGCEVCNPGLAAVLAQQAEPVEPVAWIESPHGAIRANPNYKFTFPSQLLHWQIPLYTAPPQQVAQQAEPLNLRDPAVQKRLATQWGYVPAAQAEPVEPVATLIAQRDALLEAGDYETRTGRALIGLYTSPPQRKPLTEEAISRLCDEYQSPRQLIRAVERVHGII